MLVATADMLPVLTTPGITYHAVYALSRIMPGYAGVLAYVAVGKGLPGGKDVGAGKPDLTIADLPAAVTPLSGLYDQVGGATLAVVQDVLA